ncbi:hypothetical protein CRM22_008403 [Opisthorchis felineus]|nr:hypothetical protein CRM22_008403 [Opisthorchis felineus]TGZ60648.1 hypothetical protein CRM22_008403 [Opisthorchis felineus]TGZ60649.1 hypothetical protein CRM22_008403 [Opisthorchis felineus]
MRSFGQTLLVLSFLLLAPLSRITQGLPQRTDDSEITSQVANESNSPKADDAATAVDPSTSISEVAAESTQSYSWNDNATINQNVTTELKPDPGLSPTQVDDEQTEETNVSAESEQVLTLTNTTLPDANIYTPVLPVRQAVTSNGSGENSPSNASTLAPTEHSAYTSPETTAFGYTNNISDSVTNSYVAETGTPGQFTNQSFPALEILSGTTTKVYNPPMNNTLPHTTISPESLTDIFNSTLPDLPQSTGLQKNVTVENNKPASPELLETSTSGPFGTTDVTGTAAQDTLVTSSTSNDFTNTVVNVTYSTTETSSTSELTDRLSNLINFKSSTPPQSNESRITDPITTNFTLGKLDTVNTTQLVTEDALVTQPTVGSGAINATDTEQLLTTSPSTENGISSENATVLTSISADTGMPDVTATSLLTTREQVAFDSTEILDKRTEPTMTTIYSSTVPVHFTEAHLTSSTVSTPDETTTSFVDGTTRPTVTKTTPATWTTAEVTTDKLTNSQSEYSTTVSTDSATRSLSTIGGTAYTKQGSTVPVEDSSAGTDEPTVTVKPPMLVSPGMSENMTTQIYEGTAKSPTSSSVGASEVGTPSTNQGSSTAGQISTVSLADTSTSSAATDTLTTLPASSVPTSTGIPEDSTMQTRESTIQTSTSNGTTASDLEILSTAQRSSTADQRSTILVSVTNATPTAADTPRTTVEHSVLTSSEMLTSTPVGEDTSGTSIGSGITTDNPETTSTDQGTSDDEPSSTTTAVDASTSRVGLDKSTTTLGPSATVTAITPTHTMTEIHRSTIPTLVSMGTSGDASGTNTTVISDITAGKDTEFPMQTTTDWEFATVRETTESARSPTAVEFSDSSAATMTIQSSSPSSELSTIPQTTDFSPEAVTDATTQFSSTPLASFVENASSKPTTLFDSSVTIDTSDSISTTSEDIVTKNPASFTTSETLSDSPLLSTEVNNSTISKITDHTTTYLPPVVTDVLSTTKLTATQSLRPSITKLPIMYTTSTKRGDDDDDDDDDSEDEKEKKERKDKKKDDTDDETDDEDDDKERKPKRKCDEEGTEDDELKTDQQKKHDGDDEKDVNKKKKRGKCRKQNTSEKSRGGRKGKEDKKHEDGDDTDNDQSESEQPEYKQGSNNSDTDSDD